MLALIRRQLSSDIWIYPLLAAAIVGCSPSLTSEEALAMPLECPSFIDAAVFDGEVGAGYATAQEAFDALDPIEKPSGEVRFVVETDVETTWIYFMGDDKVGEVRAQKREWGLWVIDSYERCIFDYFPTSPVP